MTKHPEPIPPGHLEALCDALADTETGLTGTELGRLLAQTGIKDREPDITKRKRLLSALSSKQRADRHGGAVLGFISAALSPARYAGKQAIFEGRRQAINVPLSLIGLEFGQDGKFHHVSSATTLEEAELRANRLRAALSARAVHSEVLRFCRAELVASNSFHAVLEAAKSVAERLRFMSGLGGDGFSLVDECLGGDNPLLRINSLSNDSEKSEQKGFATLTKGLFGTFRNPTAHTPRIAWIMPEDDALDLFTLASYCHRRLDKATKRP